MAPDDGLYTAGLLRFGPHVCQSTEKMLRFG
jgi:hypothetical protein